MAVTPARPPTFRVHRPSEGVSRSRVIERENVRLAAQVRRMRRLLEQLQDRAARLEAENAGLRRR
jgi:sugar-specific transcriptional regulator TrmB